MISITCPACRKAWHQNRADGRCVGCGTFLPDDLRAPPAVAKEPVAHEIIAAEENLLGKFGPPDKLRIPANGPIEYVGRLDDGFQYMSFITGAVPDSYVFNTDNENWRKIKCWIGVLHLFDGEGNHLTSQARHGGFEIEGWDTACDKAWAEVHAMFTPHRGKSPKGCDIFVKLFSVLIDGITHGLVYRATQPEKDGPVFEGVFLEPRDVMFHPPWDSGEWST